MGRRQDALAPTEEAVQLYRDLAAANPAFLPDLAGALNNLGVRYSNLGRRARRPGPTEEAVRALPRPGRRPTPPSCPTSPAR